MTTDSDNPPRNSPGLPPPRFRPVQTAVFFALVLGAIAFVASKIAVPQLGELEFETESEFSKIRIRRKGSVRSMNFVRDNGTEVVESRVDMDKPHDVRIAYARSMFASYLFREQHDRVLIVGLGGGSMVHFLKHHDPDLTIDAIEIDPVVVQLADKYFDVRDGDGVNIHTVDGFKYLRETVQRYDVIYMDAFLKPSADTDATGVPQRLKTIEFFKSIQEKLSPGGLVVFNINSHKKLDEDLKTIRLAFTKATVIRCPGSGNSVVVAETSAEHPSEEMLASRAKSLDEKFAASFAFKDVVSWIKD